MKLKDIIHIMDTFSYDGRRRGYDVDSQISSNKDFYVYMKPKSYEVEVSFHQYSDDNTRVDIDVSRGLVTMNWAAYDTTIADTVDFEYIMANIGSLIDAFNVTPEKVYNPPKRKVEVEDRDWW